MKKAVVFTCIFSLLAAAALLIGCGDGENGKTSTPKTPAEAAEAFWTASLKGDADTSWELLSKDVQAGLKDKAMWAKAVRNDPNASIEVGEATITGDTATVQIKILSSGTEVMSHEVTLVKEDGIWKIKIP